MSGSAVASRRSTAPAVVAGAAIASMSALIVVSYELGRWLQHRGHRMMVNAPPLTGNIEPRLPLRGVVAIALAVAVVLSARRSASLSWRKLLWVSFAVAAAWAFALAFADGSRGFLSASRQGVDYLHAVPLVRTPLGFLRGFVANIAQYPGHVRSHPPGYVLFLWGLDRLGMGGGWWESVWELLGGAASVPAVLLAVREATGEEAARRAAPFLALTSAAVFWTSGDALYLGLAAWAVALLVLASGREARRSGGLALAGGALFGAAAFLSYGLILLAIVPVAVVVSRRRWRVLVPAAVAVLAVFLAFRVAGFGWLSGLSAAREQMALGVDRVRPYSYFLLANIAALAAAVGPAVWVAVARLRDRRLWVPVGATLLALAIADLSGFAKGECERVWLPFMPWIAIATAGAFDREGERRGWLAAQGGWALLLQFVVRSPW